MTPHRKPTGLFAIGWLFLLHALANIGVGVYRCHDIHRPVTDVLAAALSRSQVCLLAAWLVVGTQRLSWRICGLIGGSCFIFVVYCWYLFPGEVGLGHGGLWLDGQWLVYFRLSGPGDLLVKWPILVVGVAGPLLVWRAVAASRRAGRNTPTPASRRPFQFRLQDVALWTFTICLVLVAFYRTAPYEGWFDSLLSRVWRIYRLEDSASICWLAGSLPYVLTTLVCLWAVYSPVRLMLRVPLTTGLVLGAAFVYEVWLRRVVRQVAAEYATTLWGQASAETVTCGVAALVMVGSLLLVRMFETFEKVNRLPEKPV